MLKDKLRELRHSYKSSLKSLDTEEHIDLFFYRPIGYVWAMIAARLGITPNAITVVGIILGIGAGVLFYFPKLAINVAGMLLLMLANSCDSADGQLARITKQYSRLGRILDGMCGDIWFITIYAAICLREMTFSPFFHQHPWLIWVIAAVTGVFHAKQAKMADYYRQFHLYFLKGEAGSELESASELEKAYREHKRDYGLVKRLTMYFYLNYTRNQEVLTPNMQALRRELHRLYPDGRIPADFRARFRALSLPLMKYTNILSFNWRTIALFTSLFIGQPWLYFVFELTVLNALMAYMMYRHERICKELLQDLRADVAIQTN